MSTNLGVVFLQQISAVFFMDYHAAGCEVIVQSINQGV
jgi:hypothetical protein